MTLPKLSKQTCERIKKTTSQIGARIVMDSLGSYEIPYKYVRLVREDLRRLKVSGVSGSIEYAEEQLKRLDYYYPTKTKIAGRMIGQIGKDIAKIGKRVGNKSLEGLSVLSKGIFFVGTAPIFGSLTEPLRKDIYDKMAEPMPWYDYQAYQEDTNTFSFYSSVMASPVAYFIFANQMNLQPIQQGLAFVAGVIESGLRASYNTELRKPGSLFGTLASKGIIYLRKKYNDARWKK